MLFSGRGPPERADAIDVPRHVRIRRVVTSGDADDITGLLRDAQAGDREALDRAFRIVYEQLKHVAHRQLAGSAATLSTTALVHETYLKLVRAEHVAASDRRHFFNLAARAMRQVLLDRARARGAAKRDEPAGQWPAGDELLATEALSIELIDLDRALNELAALDAGLGELVELRLFAGLEFDDIARLREVSERTVFRDWRKARAILVAGLGTAPA
jgi:RNA polymerase sigma factor (TIGR02999 family)